MKRQREGVSARCTAWTGNQRDEQRHDVRKVGAMRIGLFKPQGAW